jgi:D-glycero-D-manno-heptose 1,7-bisphosphate phosphatase
MRQRALLMDRDGVINIDHVYVSSIDRLDFVPGIFPFLRAVQDKGYRLAVVTNQAGVARGLYTEADHDTLTRHIDGFMAKEGVVIDFTLASFTHKEAVVSSLCRESYWRKPNPGMLLEAMQRLSVDPGRSAMIGDHLTDMQAGLAAGVRHCLWLTKEPSQELDGVTVVAGFDEALAVL